jgi:hypothetical protein
MLPDAEVEVAAQANTMRGACLASRSQASEEAMFYIFPCVREFFASQQKAWAEAQRGADDWTSWPPGRRPAQGTRPPAIT